MIGKQKKVVFFTNSDYGQSNVILAVAYELLLLQEYGIHIASFDTVKKRVDALNKSVPDNHFPAIFHEVVGPVEVKLPDSYDTNLGPFPAGVKGALQTYRVTLPAMATLWEGTVWMKGYRQCIEIINAVNPDVIILDPLFGQGLDACVTLSRDYVILSPNTYQEICRRQQPFWSRFLRYPALSCAYPYPVPWHLVLANVYLKLMLLWITITSPLVQAMLKWRVSKGLQKIPPVYNIWQKNNEYLVPSTPEIDFPCKVPSNVTGCGPILLPCSPIADDDPKMQAWLEQGPTVLINLGSLLRMTSQIAQEFASGLKIVLDEFPDLQILWKLKRSGGIGVQSGNKLKKDTKQEDEITDESLSAIAEEISNGRVKVLEWLSVNPMAVLQSPHTVCSVHHGGSNSYHEALDAGVPQVIIPCWFDTFEFAHRVEYLGVGFYGSRTATPGVERHELSQALIKILRHDAQAISIKQKAKQLAETTRKVGGRKRALEKILEVLDRS